MNKAGFYFSTICALLVLLLGTGLQAASFIAVSVLSGLNVYAKKNFYPAILAISIFMFLINLTGEVSLVDLMAWVAIAWLTYKK